MESSIAIVGNLNLDLLMGPLERVPAFGHEVFVGERTLRTGGQAFYPAVALVALGDRPCLISDVGDDAFGRQILDDLQAGGVEVGTVRVCAGRPTGLSVALLNEQRDRAFITHAGHLSEMTAGSILELWASLTACRFMLLCGYNILPGLRPDGGLALMRRAQGAGLTTVLDTGWDPDDWRTGMREEVLAMLPYTGIFMPNREEARALTGLDDPDEAAAELVRRGARLVILKLGPDGALALHGGRRLRVGALPTVVADTVGAGDSFNAGALFALAQDWPLEAALRLGAAVASYAIAGHTPRYPTLDQARGLMAQVLVAGTMA
jgi:sugar/nucleoside kinase (ribokinase family)